MSNTGDSLRRGSYLSAGIQSVYTAQVNWAVNLTRSLRIYSKRVFSGSVCCSNIVFTFLSHGFSVALYIINSFTHSVLHPFSLVLHLSKTLCKLQIPRALLPFSLSLSLSLILFSNQVSFMAIYLLLRILTAWITYFQIVLIKEFI